MPAMTLGEARKRWFAAAADKSVSYEEFVRHWRRVVRIQEATIREANVKIMKGEFCGGSRSIKLPQKEVELWNSTYEIG